MSTPPVITIKGKKHTMPKPKIKLWKLLIEFDQKRKNGELEGVALFEEMAEIMAVAFGNPEITKEVIEDSVDVEEVVTVFAYIKVCAEGIVGKKAMQLPNAQVPAGI